MPTLRAFMKEMANQHPRASQIRHELKGLKVKSAKSTNAIDDKFLLELLPPKNTVDYYIQEYVESFERLYRVLHLPTFWADYAEFWKSPSKQPFQNP